MNPLPCPQQLYQMLNQCPFNPCQVATAESIVLPQCHRSLHSPSGRPVHQLKDSFASLSNDVNVHRSMVIGIDDNAQVANPENGWQIEGYLITKSKRLGFVVSP